MEEPVKSIVIVGGGSAGWLTAGILAATLKSRGAHEVSVTLIESPAVPIIGVGEGTWPTMRNTLKRIGIRETDFVRNCNVSFKQGAKFQGWTTGLADDAYYHPLVLPEGYFELNLAPHWHESDRRSSFSKMVCSQEEICELGLAPKLITTPEYAGVLNYAYHLDAGAFSAFLRKHCVGNLNVRHVLDDVTGVNTLECGDIASVTTRQGGELSGDLFIDCSGFQSVLLGKHFGVPFRSCKDVLFIDRALAVHVPYENEESPILSHTLSTAREHGWIWDVGLPHRRGIGYVYSSGHCSDSKAETNLRNYLHPLTQDAAALNFKAITIDPGHRERFWERNCVAVGLAAGFLEPLEASALLLIEISATKIAEQLPVNRQTMAPIAKRYNQALLYHWDRIIDFLKLHYVLSHRTDSDFWYDNRASTSIPDSLQDLLTIWRYHYPWHDDFDRAKEVFPAASYQYVLYGMGFQTEACGRASESDGFLARQFIEKVREETGQLTMKLPTNRQLLAKINQYGLQKI